MSRVFMVTTKTTMAMHLMCHILHQVHIWGMTALCFPTLPVLYISFQPSGTNDVPNTLNQANISQGDVSTSVATDEVQIPICPAKGNHNVVGNALSNRTNVLKHVRPNYQKPSIKSNDFYGWEGLASGISSSWFWGHKILQQSALLVYYFSATWMFPNLGLAPCSEFTLQAFHMAIILLKKSECTFSSTSHGMYCLSPLKHVGKN